ncbi:MAG TPA: OB-fold domain-containing protein [Nevskia sp.]|nr:OB-fold domain-containing protein [Nevskia sp.]
MVATVELEEGYRLVTNLYGVELKDVKVDLPVEVYFEPTMGNHKVPVFRPRAK